MPGPQPKYAITLTPEQAARLQPLSTCSRAACAPVQRAQILVLAHRHPQWQNATIAQRVGCRVTTVQRWRQRWQTTAVLSAAPRAGTRSPFTSLPRAQIVALACRTPRQYNQPWQHGSGEKLAQGAVAQGVVAASSPGTIRRGLRADKVQPWRYHSWQHSTDRQLVEKATPVLDLYAQAPALQAQGERTVGTEEKTSGQARQWVTTTKAPAPGAIMQVADR